MVTFKKFKYVIFSLLALAVIASAAASSVSYAKWAGGSNNTQLDAGLSTGEWDNKPSGLDIDADTGVAYIDSNGEVHTISMGADIEDVLYNAQSIFDNNEGGVATIYIETSARNQRFKIKLATINIAEWNIANNTGTDTIKVQDGEFILDCGENAKTFKYYVFTILYFPSENAMTVMINQADMYEQNRLIVLR